MAFHHTTAILLLSIILIGVSPRLVASLSSDSGLYRYITSGLERIEHEKVKRETTLQPASEEDIKLAFGQAEESLRHLAHFENVLHGRRLMAADGSPSHIAAICSWSDDQALSIARKSYLYSRASYLLNHQICMRYGKTASFCGNQMMQMFQTPIPSKACAKQVYRTYNGSCNNELHPSWGSAFSAYSRLLPPTYKDGIWEPRDRGLMPKYANALEISEGVQKKTGKLLKDITLTAASWAGLVAYDLSHTVSNRMFSNGDAIMCCEDNKWKLSPRSRHPLCMPVIDKRETKCFNYVRSMLAPSEEYRFGPAQQMNGASHLLDGSGIYGSTAEVSKSQRTGHNGRIRVVNSGSGASLPHLFSTTRQSYPFKGEMRLNTDVISAVMHVVLINEHNRIAEELHKVNPKWNDEKLFQESRRIVIAEIQHITYSEWLPVILGEKEVMKHGLQIPTSGYGDVYDQNVQPSVANSFANAAMRFMVSLLDEQLHLFNEDRTPSGNMSLEFSLIEPKMFADGNKLASLVRSLATQNCQANDLYFPESVTKYLYSSANRTGFDALSMDIQRGRDHGLPPYAAFRKLYGYPYEHFDDLTSTIRAEVVSKLKKAYEKVGSIDLIVGGLAETPRRGSLLGPVFTNIIAEQMAKTRLGDRYFYDNQHQPHPFSPEQLSEIRKVRLARLLCDNTLVKKMQPNAFRKPSVSGNRLTDCSDKDSIERLNLNLWKESP